MKKTGEPLQPRLGVFDGVSIIVGIVVGVSIFRSSPMVFGAVSHAWMGMAVWVLGGALSLVGAMCYAELATTYPRSGGDYVYLSRAYGRWCGFLFGWAQLAVILTGSIGAMAYVFADYSTALFGVSNQWGVYFAVGAVAALSAINLLGVVTGKTTQNLLSVLKIAGLVAVAVAGFYFGGEASLAPATAGGSTYLGLAMIFVLYTYGGWNDAAFVAAEVRNGGRNIPRVLLLGTALITLVYLLVNLAYLWGLGLEGLRASQSPAADLLGRALGAWGAKAMSVLVMISALGAMNGLILTGSRIHASVGADHRLFSLLGRWNRLGAPVWSILIQGLVTLLMVVAVGTAGGREAIDGSLMTVNLSPLPWEDFGGGFDTLVTGTAGVFWLFFLLTGLSLFSLREKDHGIERPFSVPWYPFVPFVFCLTCCFMLYSSLTYAGALSMLGFVPLAVGAPLYWLSRTIRGRDEGVRR